MDKEPTLQERFDEQNRITQMYFNLWQQSQGAATMLQELIKQEESECTDLTTSTED